MNGKVTVPCSLLLVGTHPAVPFGRHVSGSADGLGYPSALRKKVSQNLPCVTNQTSACEILFCLWFHILFKANLQRPPDPGAGDGNSPQCSEAQPAIKSREFLQSCVHPQPGHPCFQHPCCQHQLQGGKCGCLSLRR